LIDFPRILRTIDAAPPGALLPDVHEGYGAWLRAGADRSDAAGLLAKIHEARLTRVHKEDLGLFQFVSEGERAFDERWQRINRYHLNFIFEFLYLSLLVLFIAWPWLRRAGPKRWASHLALLPILFFLPW